MFDRIREKVKRNDGEIMIEMTLIFVVVIYCIFFLLDLGMLTYHQEMLTATANEAAASVARTYHAKAEKDPFYAIMKPEGFKAVRPYRHFGEETIQKRVEKQGKTLGQYLLTKRVFPKIGTITEDNVMVECNRNALGMTYIEITLKCDYEPLLNLSGMLGGEDMEKRMITAKGTAICYDLIDELNEDALEYELYLKAAEIFNGTKTAEILDHVGNIISNITQIFS